MMTDARRTAEIFLQFLERSAAALRFLDKPNRIQ
jgi:hypothetical protein